MFDVRVLAAVVLVVGIGACAQTPAGDRAVPPAAPTVDPTTSVTYAPGLSADLYLPQRRHRAPLVVMVPGGGWVTADPAGFAGLAAALAAEGVAAAPAHVRAAEDDVIYPVPVEDVLCAVASVAEEMRARGVVPDPVVVLGHSSGGHLAALAALTVDELSPSCAAPLVRPDALVGLSGPYDIAQVPDAAVMLLGTSPDDDPATWSRANPVEQADLRPEVTALLLHGDRDETVPVDQSTGFASALEDGGHATTVEVVPGATHETIFTADVAAAPVLAWLAAAGGPRSPS